MFVPAEERRKKLLTELKILIQEYKNKFGNSQLESLCVTQIETSMKQWCADQLNDVISLIKNLLSAVCDVEVNNAAIILQNVVNEACKNQKYEGDKMFTSSAQRHTSHRDTHNVSKWR